MGGNPRPRFLFSPDQVAQGPSVHPESMKMGHRPSCGPQHARPQGQFVFKAVMAGMRRGSRPSGDLSAIPARRAGRADGLNPPENNGVTISKTEAFHHGRVFWPAKVLEPHLPVR